MKNKSLLLNLALFSIISSAHASSYDFGIIQTGDSPKVYNDFVVLEENNIVQNKHTNSLLVEENKNLTSEIALIRAGEVLLHKQLLLMEEVKVSLITDLAFSKNKNIELSTANKKLSSRNDSSLEKIDNLNTKVTSLNKDLGDQFTEINNLNNTIISLNGLSKEKDEMIIELKNKSIKLASINTELSNKNMHQLEENNALSEQISVLSKDKADGSTEISNLTDSIKHLKEGLANKDSEINQLKSSLSKALLSINPKDNSVELVSINAELSNKNKHQLEKINTLSEQISILGKDKINQNIQNAELVNKIILLKEDMIIQSNKIDELKVATPSEVTLTIKPEVKNITTNSPAVITVDVVKAVDEGDQNSDILRFKERMTSQGEDLSSIDVYKLVSLLKSSNEFSSYNSTTIKLIADSIRLEYAANNLK